MALRTCSFQASDSLYWPHFWHLCGDIGVLLWAKSQELGKKYWGREQKKTGICFKFPFFSKLDKWFEGISKRMLKMFEENSWNILTASDNQHEFEMEIILTSLMFSLVSLNTERTHFWPSCKDEQPVNKPLWNIFFRFANEEKAFLKRRPWQTCVRG